MVNKTYIDKSGKTKSTQLNEDNDNISQSDFLAGIVNFSEDAIIGMSLDGTIKSWNIGAEKIFGYSAYEVLGKSVNIIYPPAHDEELTIIVEKIKKGESINHYETERINRDGKIINISLSFSPIRGKNNDIIGFSKIVRDFTGQRIAAQYARSLIEASLDPLVTISPDGKITDVNEATVQITGVSRAKLIGTDFSNYFTEPEKAREGFKNVFLTGKVIDFPLTICHSSGKTTEVLYNASVYKNNKDQVLGVFAAARDITAIKKASQYARSLIEASLDPLITISPQGKITDVNAATIEVTGIPKEELIGSDFSGHFTEPEEAQEGYQQVLKEGYVRDFPLVIRHVSGRITHVLYNATLYKDTDGNVQGIFAAARDITERRKVEELLHATSAYARSLIESSLDPLVTISPEGKITDVNHATELITGVSREWLIGTDFSTYFTEPRKARQGYRKAFKEGSVRDYPLVIRNSSGNTIDVLYNATVYRDAQGKIRGVFAAARDITKTKQVSQYARSLIEASLDPLFTISPKGKITDVNEATVKITGISRESLIGTDFFSYFTEPEKARTVYEQVFKQGFVTDYALVIRHVSGKTTDVLYNASIYKDDKGQVLGVFAAARDYTRLKQITKQLESSNKELEAFSYSVSHDLRAPLRAISGFSELLLKGYLNKLDDQGKQYLQFIKEDSERMAQLIDNMIELSRFTNRKLNIKTIDLTLMVSNIAKEFQEQEKDRDVEFIIAEELTIQADEPLMIAVIKNLLGNAWKFTSKRKHARIEVGQMQYNGKTTYFIQDNGAGFNMEYAGKLFGAFQRLHSDEEFSGNGIGLATVQRIINRHGGQIWAEGAVNKGAKFFFTLS